MRTNPSLSPYIFKIYDWNFSRICEVKSWFMKTVFQKTDCQILSWRWYLPFYHIPKLRADLYLCDYESCYVPESTMENSLI